MLRSSAPRAAFRAQNSSPLPTRVPLISTKAGPKLVSRLTTLSNGRRLSLTKPLSMALGRSHSNTRVLQDKIDYEHERRFAQRKLSAHPELVSMTSTTQTIFAEDTTSKDEDTDMTAGIRADIKTIRETFSLDSVPKEAYYVGMAGVLPYLATSLSTVFCAYEINLASYTGSGMLLSGRTAEALLHVIEPLQIGYGAVIISFLGAIHWGLEFAGYGGYHGYSRYSIGVVAPAIAWPTILFPAETALIAQFLAFNFLYYTDSRAAKRGWAPPWYAVYRFVLTFVVGASIVATLIGRGQISDQIGKLPAPADRIKALRAAQAEELAKEEEARRRQTVLAEEEDEEE